MKVLRHLDLRTRVQIEVLDGVFDLEEHVFDGAQLGVSDCFNLLI